MSQRGPESGTDKDRFIVGSKFWSPPPEEKAPKLSALKPPPCLPLYPHHPRAINVQTRHTRLAWAHSGRRPTHLGV